MANEETGRVLNWDDEIEKDGSFTLLDEGDYNFEVVAFKRDSFPGGKKIPACNKATLTLRIYDNDGNQSQWKEDFILHSSLEWKLSEIHRAVGLKKHGEKLKMKWKEMVGLTGCCKVIVTTWTGRDGEEHESNKVDKYYDPETFGANEQAPAPKKSMFARKK